MGIFWRIMNSCWQSMWYKLIGFSEILFKQENVAYLPNLPNLPWPMKESINLIGELLGQNDLFKCVQILNKCLTRKVQMVELMVLYSFNGWTQIVQLPVFRKIRLIRQITQPYQKNFWKPKMWHIKQRGCVVYHKFPIFLLSEHTNKEEIQHFHNSSVLSTVKL